MRKTIISISIFVLLTICQLPEKSTAQSVPEEYPLIAGVYLRSEVRDIDTLAFSYQDLIIFPRRIDLSNEYRHYTEIIKRLNPNGNILLYCQSTSTHNEVEPPDPIKVAADEYDWWLKSYEGDYLFYGGWTFLKLLNMTNSDAASGTHPTGMRANQFVPELLINDHILTNSYWDGIFYDTFSDNLGWMHRDIKDGTRDNIPEYDDQPNENQPPFSDLWNTGMTTLVRETKERKEDIIIIGNGGHRSALSYVNGKFTENYSRGDNLNNLSPLYMYMVNSNLSPRLGILNGVNTDLDPADYITMRFSLGSALLIGLHLSFDFGSQCHGEYLWYDEYNVQPTGEVAAVTAELKKDLNNLDETISVASTGAFRPSGLIFIDDEIIHYRSKNDSTFLSCYRGYPKPNETYDLRAPHSAGAAVVQYNPEHKGYLGKPVAEAYDVNSPETTLGGLFLEAGWYPDEQETENIISRIWRRDFENGTVIVNPTSSSQTVSGLGNGELTKIKGLQDPVHNDGALVVDSLVIGSRDSYILLHTSGDQIPPESPEGLNIKGN